MRAPGSTHPCTSCESQVPADAAFCPACGAARASPILSDTLLGVARGGAGPATSYEQAPALLECALGPDYELGRLLGRGGYAEVFTVRDLRLRRELALKVLRPDLLLTDALVARFRREAEAVGALQHPHIVPVYDVGEKDGVCWLLMPLVTGETLKSLLAREGRLPVAEARRILLEAANALQAAHDAGIVHRDIKPENLMIEGRTQRVLLMDFGIAKAMDASGESALTGTGVVIGTAKYMSPEQAVGKRELDPRSDQYALAVVGYQMLSGRVPFEGENLREVLARQLLDEAIPLSRLLPDVPPELSTTIHQALHKDPRLRFTSMDAFARALRGETISPAEGGRVRRRTGFHIPVGRRPWIAGAVWLVALAGGLFAANRAGLFQAADPGALPPSPPAPVAPSPPAAARAPNPAPGRRPGAPPAARDTGGLAGSGPAGAEPSATCAHAMIAEDWPGAVQRCTREAETNSAARRNLGLLYAEGRGVARDDRVASVHLGLAAQDLVQPDTQAIVLMADRWDRGIGVAVDRGRGAGLWEVAAGMGIPRAFPIIAARYAAGDGRRRSDSAAFVWYARAAEAGDVPSMTRTAERYASGQGIRKNENLSATWYARAAEQGDPEAQYQVALLLFRGRFFPRDDAAGMLWLERAARQGHVNALAELARRRR